MHRARPRIARIARCGREDGRAVHSVRVSRRTFTQRERDAVERAGYHCAVIVGGRWGNGAETDRFLLKREPMLASDSLDWFARRVNGFYEWHYLWARARGIETR